MGAPVGGRADTRCLLTLYRRPTSLRLAMPTASQTRDAALAGLGLVDAAPGSGDAVGRVFGAVLADNGGEFSDEGAVAGALGERGGEAGPYYCDGRRADRKGGVSIVLSSSGMPFPSSGHAGRGALAQAPSRGFGRRSDALCGRLGRVGDLVPHDGVDHL